MIKIVVASLSFLMTGMTQAQSLESTREVILDNADVEVVRLTYPAGTESGMHTHPFPFRVVYFVKGGKLLLQAENSEQPDRILDVVDGQTLYLPATTHNVKNIGTSKVIIVETEIKKSVMR